MPKSRRTQKPSLAKRPSKPDNKVKALMQRLVIIQNAYPQAAEAFPFADYLRSIGVEDVGDDMEAIARDIPEHFADALKHWGEVLEQKAPAMDPIKAEAARRVGRLKEIIDELNDFEVVRLLGMANHFISSRGRPARTVESGSPEWSAMWSAIKDEFGDVVQENDGECWQYMGSEGDDHSFRHRYHPNTKSRLYVTVRNGAIITRSKG